MSVDLVLHYRYGGGSDVRQATISDVSRVEAESFIKSIGPLRKSDGTVTVSVPEGIKAMIPARNIDLAEVRVRA